MPRFFSKKCNMKFFSPLLLLTLLVPFTSQSQVSKHAKTYIDYVNPLMGTDSKFSLSNGNTYPAIAVPWGMNFWSPQTAKMGDGWMYSYSADKIRGFKQTHQPSPWMNDYGNYVIMPATGSLVFDENKRASWFSHKAEIAAPDYYQVYLADADVITEITTSERAAQFRFTYPQTDSAFLIVDALDKGSYIKVIPEENKIIGYTTRNSGGVGEQFKNYFIVQLDQAFQHSWIWKDSTLVNSIKELESHHTGVVVGFKTKKGQIVNVKTASSFISFEQAELNLKREIGTKDFNTTRQESRNKWNELLGRIQVMDTDQPEQKATFYSCLYRTLLFPQKHYEIDANNEIVHYSPYSSKVEKGYFFAGTGFWDTFRALYPLLNLVYPEINIEMQKGLVNAFEKGGFLPEWSSPGFRNVMVGNNSASVVADAYVKGLRGYDIETLWKALVKGAHEEGPMDAVGRRGAPYYNKLGYVPYNVGIRENAARTLEYAYDDFTIAQLGKLLNKSADTIAYFYNRGLNYKKLYDDSTKLMRGKNEDGSFQYPFNPLKWGDAFTEGNSLHYSWSVFHDVAGLKTLMGGDKIFNQMLDTIFQQPPHFDESYYGAVIHEIREMQIMNMGQYAHGNQPIQHVVYLYNYGTQPWKTQLRVREIMNKLYFPTPDGYCGDEDNGQTSAWYVFSALGFYPVCPGTTEYVLGSPLFKQVKINLPNGKVIDIKADDNYLEHPYVQELKWNGKVYEKNYLDHFELLKGAQLHFKMGEQPNKKRGIGSTSYPYSYSTHYKK